MAFMKFSFENLGPLRTGEVELADLTILCGENNTGKTYVTYAIYGLLENWRTVFDADITKEQINSLKREGSLKIDLQNDFIISIEDYVNKSVKAYEKVVHNILSAKKENFKNTTIKLSVPLPPQNYKEKFERSYRFGANRLSLTITKPSDSNILEIVCLPDAIDTPSFTIEHITEEAIQDIVLKPLFPNDVYIFSAERTGTSIFRKDLNIGLILNSSKSSFLEINDIYFNKNITPIELWEMVPRRYPQPVLYDIMFVDNLEETAKKSSPLVNAQPDFLTEFEDMIGGQYHASIEGLYFLPKNSNTRLTMGESSSSIRSMLHFGFYLRHLAKAGDMIMIDEPELNLHPVNQRRFARLIVKLVNAGIRVFISTHSDYIVKELNILIILNQDLPHFKQVRETFSYDKSEKLNPNNVRLYMATKQPEGSVKLVQAPIYPDQGIWVETFDKNIDDMNLMQNELRFGE